jgi:membrane-bound ClpP family serine protease
MWIIILTLLLIGLMLVVVELVFIPGTTIVGLLGAVFVIAGVFIGYRHFGDTAGNYILLGVSVTLIITLVYSFRSSAWTKFALKTSMDSKVNEGLTDTLKVGDEGKTISTLRPGGRAEFNDQQYEVRTLGSYVEQNTSVKIIQLDLNTIVVEPIN